MEEIKIPMLSRFDTISHVMPYYAHTHKAFLLLSNLCKTSRNKLDEFYDEFMECMKYNWLKITILLERMKKLLPTDLFIIMFEFEYQSDQSKFIEIIKSLTSFNCCYFNKHSMNLNTKLQNPISIDIYLMNQLTQLKPYMKTLKSIKVRFDENLSQPISLATAIVYKIFSVIKLILCNKN